MTSVLTGLSGEEFVTRATSVEAASFGAATVAGPLLAATLAGAAGAGGRGRRPGGPQGRRHGADARRRGGRAARRCGRRRARRSRGRRRSRPGIRHFVASAGRWPRSPRAAGSRWRRAACSSSRSRSSRSTRSDAARTSPASSGPRSRSARRLGAIALSGFAARWPSERVALGAVAARRSRDAADRAARGDPATLALLVLSGLLYGPGLAATFDLRRRVTPPEFLGQVSTMAASVKGASFALGAAAVGSPRRGDRRRRHDPRRRGDASGGERERRPHGRLRAGESRRRPGRTWSGAGPRL